MSDYLIDLQTAIEAMSRISDSICEAEAVDALCEVPTIELIRCKDCKYWDVSKSNIMNHTCHWGYFLKKEDDYCSWAKPKEKYEKEEDKGSD